MRRRGHGDPVFSFILFGVFAVVAMVVYAISYVRRKQRTEALAGLAETLGLSFSPDGNEGVLADLDWCELFSRGRGQGVLNLMRGSNEGREVAVFDHLYVTGHGKHSHTWRTTIAWLQFDGPPLPGFSLRPEGMWD